MAPVSTGSWSDIPAKLVEGQQRGKSAADGMQKDRSATIWDQE